MKRRKWLEGESIAGEIERMSNRALIVVREASGVASLAESLAGEFGYAFSGNQVAVDALESKGIACELVEDKDAVSLIMDAEQGITLLVANFVDVETAGRSFMSWKSALGAFDRGIVEAIRAAGWAVNQTAVLGNPADYDSALEELRENGGKFRQAFRMERATAALRAASEFDFAVAQYLEVQGADAPDMGALSGYSKAMRFAWSRAELLDTGENSHQLAAVYGGFYEHFRHVSGPKLSYAAVLTVSRAAYLIGEFERPAAALLRNGKVVTACCGSELEAVLDRVLSHEDLAGSWLVVNGSAGVDGLAKAIESEVAGVLAPDYSEEEFAGLSGVEKVTAIASISGLGYEALQEVRSVVGGVLVQDKDRAAINPMEWTVLGLAQPLVDDWEALLFGAKVVRHTDSASIAIVSGERLIALETGHYSSKRAWSAIEECGIELANTVAVFDGPEVEPATLKRMKVLGVRAVLLPISEAQDSLREAANECGLVLLGMSKGLRRL
ncbi:hypothetical protein [Pelagicoccus mobilis]|uniref:Uncharacterized protein n=1 Tax=Pelagicoccus mobilis TaxID=415221 RepID=A0A934S2P2_9BACT|nr:hypothetical protein [Pelagicoccus mobilis]MBK1880080.1 hypothetical protein [Pelagicoccus mobilis]